jgi:hypothetical protein
MITQVHKCSDGTLWEDHGGATAHEKDLFYRWTRTTTISVQEILDALDDRKPDDYWGTPRQVVEGLLKTVWEAEE